MGAFSHLSMYRSAHVHFTCFRTARMSNVVVDVVKQAVDVEFQNPVILPAPLARDSYGIQRRFVGPISVGVCQKDRFQRPAQSICLTTI